MNTLEFPVKTTVLSQYIPHRHPMLWIDEVLWVGDDDGECLVKIDTEAHYFDKKHIRFSSYVEWIAQAHAFIKACQLIIKEKEKVTIPKDFFLAGVKNFEMNEEHLRSGDSLKIYTKVFRHLSPFSIIRGHVQFDNKILATGELKVFSQ